MKKHFLQRVAIVLAVCVMIGSIPVTATEKSGSGSSWTLIDPTETRNTASSNVYANALYMIEHPDPNYHGHTVALTDSQYLKVLRSIYGEQEVSNFAICVGLCQYIRDYIDYGTTDRTYDNLGSRWLIRGGSFPASMDLNWFQTYAPDAIDAVNFVFGLGGSLAQAPMHFYVDDDDAALDGSYEAAYNWLSTVACGEVHYHDRLRLAPQNYPSNWIEFCF